MCFFSIYVYCVFFLHFISSGIKGVLKTELALSFRNPAQMVCYETQGTCRLKKPIIYLKK